MKKTIKREDGTEKSVEKLPPLKTCRDSKAQELADYGLNYASHEYSLKYLSELHQ